jgi:hypothetical protein
MDVEAIQGRLVRSACKKQTSSGCQSARPAERLGVPRKMTSPSHMKYSSGLVQLGKFGLGKIGLGKFGISDVLRISPGYLGGQFGGFIAGDHAHATLSTGFATARPCCWASPVLRRDVSLYAAAQNHQPKPISLFCGTFRFPW